MSGILWTPAGRDELIRMGPKLRPADRREWRTVSGSNNIRAQMAGAFELSRYCFVGRPEDQPAAQPFVAYGVADSPDEDSAGIIWLCATLDIVYYRRALFRDSPGRIAWLFERGGYSVLHNVVDLRNKTHIKWLRAIGAIVTSKPVVLVRGHPFGYFRIKPNV